MKLFRPRQGCAVKLLESPHDGFAQGMFRRRFRCGCQPVQLFFANSRSCRPDSCHLRHSIRQGTGLIKGYFRYAGQALQGIAFADEEPVLRHVADTGHDSRRRSQYEGAGTKYDENGLFPQ